MANKRRRSSQPCRWLACAPVRGILLCLTVLLGFLPLASAQSGWSSYGQDSGAADYSPLHQIDTTNVTKLTQAWIFHYGAGDFEEPGLGLDYRFEVTPLVINGVMYLTTPTSPRKPDLKSYVVALEPDTGKVIWKYESPENIHGRGLAYWPGGHGIGAR